MTKASDNVFPRLLVSEGGSTSTPASGNVTVYAKADGLLYSKDDAGTEKLLSSGPAAGTTAGTSFPGSPSTNDQFFRTDLWELYAYTGSAWHCLGNHVAHMEPADGGSAATTTAAIDSNYAGAGFMNGADVYLLSFHWQINIATTNNGTNFWTWTLQKLEAGATTGTAIVAPTSAALSTGWSGGSTAINAAHTDIGALRVVTTKTLTPGGFIGWFSVGWRHIAT